MILDELHSLVTSKRGDLLSLGLARLFTIAPQLATVGLSATVAEPDDLRRYLVPQPPSGEAHADLVIAEAGAAPDITMLDTAERLPWAGHTARHALGEIYDADQAPQDDAGLRQYAQPGGDASSRQLWRINDDNLAIALHHGSLDVGAAPQGRRRDGGRAPARRGRTSTLDLGIDWGDVDLVINVGAPKGASRLLQRIGRANHRMDEPSRGVLVPANRFEVLECRAALDAVADERAGHAAAAHRRARRAGAARARLRLRRAVPRRRALRRGDDAPRPMRASRARISTPRSISSRPAAMR